MSQVQHSDTRGEVRRILPRRSVSLGTSTMKTAPRNSRDRVRTQSHPGPHGGNQHGSCSTCLLTAQKGKEREQRRLTAIRILGSATAHGHRFPAHRAPAGSVSNALRMEHCKLGPAASAGSCWIPGEPLAGRGLGAPPAGLV